MVTVPDIIAAMKPIIAAVDGVGAVHYPAPDTIKNPIEVVLYWGGLDRTRISMDMGKQRMWQPMIRAHVITPMKGNTPKEFARIDNVVTPIIDAFDAGTVTQIMPSLGGAVDRCQVVDTDNSILVEFAGHKFYGAEIVWSVKFHRRAGG